MSTPVTDCTLCSDVRFFVCAVAFAIALTVFYRFLRHLKEYDNGKGQGLGPNNYKILAITMLLPFLLTLSLFDVLGESDVTSALWGALLGYAFTAQKDAT